MQSSFVFLKLLAWLLTFLLDCLYRGYPRCCFLQLPPPGVLLAPPSSTPTLSSISATSQFSVPTNGVGQGCREGGSDWRKGCFCQNAGLRLKNGCRKRNWHFNMQRVVPAPWLKKLYAWTKSSNKSQSGLRIDASAWLKLASRRLKLLKKRGWKSQA